jgi:hypothetical protein
MVYVSKVSVDLYLQITVLHDVNLCYSGFIFVLFLLKTFSGSKLYSQDNFGI